MTMGNRIGFRHYDDDQSTKNVEQSPANGDKTTEEVNNTPEKELTHKDLFKKFLCERYDAFGTASRKVYKTSRDLAYESRDMCEPSLPDIAAVMEELEFKTDSFMGHWTWVLFEKEPYRY